MVIETAQILSTAIRVATEEAGETLETDLLYPITHKNHPVMKWARASRANYQWLWKLGLHLAAEYTRRYGKIHKSEAVIYMCGAANYKVLLDITMTPFAQCMPEQYKNANVVKAYRDYYKGEKAYFAQWRYTSVPEWFYEK